jgi:hypothetical protein
MRKPILCVDFDGVIHSYSSGWQGPTTVSDPPVDGVVSWLAAALELFDVVIYSSRSSQSGGIDAMKAWLKENAGAMWYPSPGVCGLEDVRFAAEKPAAFLTIDDRAICFHGDWAAISPAELLNFKPWNKK